MMAVKNMHNLRTLFSSRYAREAAKTIAPVWAKMTSP